jgi:beta-phosphoglucomutase
MTVKAIVFDFDGVLADSEMLHLRVYNELLAAAGVRLSTEEYCEKYLGFDDEGAFQQARRFEALVAASDVLYPGAAACVRRLGAEWPLGIASGARRGEIEIMLRGAGLLNAFRFIVAAGETENGKPAPDPYVRAAELHGVPPGACLAIEDSHAGLESARAAGMRTVAISTTYPRETLVADAVIGSLDEFTVEFIRRMADTP